MTESVSLLEAQMLADAHARSQSGAGVELVVADVTPLRFDAGWVAWLSGAEYERTHDPMDFVATPALLITAGPAVTPLPTAVPVDVMLRELGLE